MAKGNPPIAAGKAKAFADDAKEAGWDVSYEYSDSANGREVVIASKGKADNPTSLTLVWDNNRYNYGESEYVVSGGSRTVRNASEARRILTGELKPQPGKGTGRQVAKKTKAGNGIEKKTEEKLQPVRVKPKLGRMLPWDEETVTEGDILKAVVGKRLVWKNRISGGYNEARVLPDPNQKQLYIASNSKQERCLNFAAQDGGFRSVRLSAIIRVTK